MEFGELIGTGTMYFTRAYRARPYFHIHTDDGSEGEVAVTKQKLDTAADQLCRQIQLAGKVDDDTEDLFAYLTQDLSHTESMVYTVDSAFITKSGCGKAIQLGSPFM